MTEVTYITEELIAGKIETQQANLAADTYFKGMPLQYDKAITAAGTADVGNTGDGTVTGVAAITIDKDKIIKGSYNLECTAEVANGGVFKLEDPNGNLIESGITMTPGALGASTFFIGGLTFIITDGAEDFDIGDIFLLIVGDGVYSYLADGQLAGIFLEHDGRVLSAVGAGSLIVGGEVYEGGFVDDAGDALVITEEQIAAWEPLGFYVKRK